MGRLYRKRILFVSDSFPNSLSLYRILSYIVFSLFAILPLFVLRLARFLMIYIVVVIKRKCKYEKESFGDFEECAS